MTATAVVTESSAMGVVLTMALAADLGSLLGRAVASRATGLHVGTIEHEGCLPVVIEGYVCPVDRVMALVAGVAESPVVNVILAVTGTTGCSSIVKSSALVALLTLKFGMLSE